jgi:hypothetical protein
MKAVHSRHASAGIAACAVLFSHWVAYAVVSPDAHERAHRLAETGHAWLPYAPYMAGAGLFLFVLGLSKSRDVSKFRWVMAPATAYVYAAIEVGERLVSNSHHGLVDISTLTVGSLIAAALGVFSAVLLKAGEKIVAALKARKRQFARVRKSFALPHARVHVTQDLHGSNLYRGPPAVAPALKIEQLCSISPK